MDDFRYAKKPSGATTKLTHFAVSKDEWNTKKNSIKSIKNALYVRLYAKTKGTYIGEGTANSKKSRTDLLSQSVILFSQSVTESVIQYKISKFCSNNFLKAFWADLKA